MPNIAIEKIQEIEYRMLEAVLDVFKKNQLPYFALYGTALGAVRHKGTIPWDCDIDLGIPYATYKKTVDCLRKDLDPRYHVFFYDTEESYFFLFARVGYAGQNHGYIHIDLFPLVGAPSGTAEQRKMLDAYNEIYRFYPMKKLKPVWARTPMRRIIKQSLNNLRQVFYGKSASRLLDEYERLCSQIPYEQASFLYTACSDEGERSFFPKAWFGKGQAFLYHSLSLCLPAQFDAYLRQTYGDYNMFPPEDVQKKGLSFQLDVPASMLET